MKTLTKGWVSLALIFAFPVGPAEADELKDPRERDEDISGATVEVEIDRNKEGFYEYIYTVSNPESRKGTVGGLLIGLQCDQDFEDSGLPPQDDGARWNFGIGGPEEGRVPRTPAITRAPENQGNYSLTVSGGGRFGMHIEPGDSWTEMRIVSPVGPGMRRYRLKPSFNMNPAVWDYDSVEVGEELPGPRDFWVYGMIEAPACPGVTPPPGEARFAGTGQQNVPENINELLTYSEPLRDRLTVSEDTVRFTIHYYERIDPETFKVQPGWAKRYFDPEPGASETVELPLRGPVNRFQFRVRPPKSDKSRDEDPYHHSFQDRDVFEIRLDGHPGGDRGPGGNRGRGRND